MEYTLVSILEKLLKKNQISFDKEELAFQIKSHPSYPSLHAITGVLDHFNIENIAAEVPINLEILKQLPNCFIAQINDDNSQNLIVVEQTKSMYTIYNAKGKKETISKNIFLKKFTGIIVAVEKLENSSTKTNSIKISKLIILAILGLSISFLLLNSTALIYNLSYLILSIIGIVISITIIKQELGLQTSIGHAFCTNSDDKKDCDAVLTSKGAEVIKDYKLSDFSLVYFTSLTLITFIQIRNPVLSFTTSLLAIPITIYSLYYQYVIIKKWCLLCLTIVSVLWLQALIPILEKNYPKDFFINESIIFGVIIISSWLIWSFIKPFILELTTLRTEKIEAVKFKRNFKLFENLLNRSSKQDTIINDSEEIIFGNRNSNLEIVVVTNPLCSHCKPIHRQIDNILHKYHDKVNVKIRFNINTKDKNHSAVKIASRLLEIFKEKGEHECLLAMNEIYKEGNTMLWLKKWGNSKTSFISELDKESLWCRNNAINFTPQILINGQSFPKEYKRTDLIFFIEELEEKYNQTLIPIKEIQTT